MTRMIDKQWDRTEEESTSAGSWGWAATWMACTGTTGQRLADGSVWPEPEPEEADEFRFEWQYDLESGGGGRC